MDSERLLPKDQRLNAYIEELSTDIYSSIEQLKVDHDGNLLDSNVEFYNTDSFRNFASIAYALETDILKGGSMASYQTMYRAAVFAFQVSIEVHGQKTQFEAGPYIKLLAEHPHGPDILMTDVQLYLAENPAVADLLDDYLDELDEGRNLQHLGELSAGMIFMLVERSAAEEFILEEMQDLTVHDRHEDE